MNSKHSTHKNKKRSKKDITLISVGLLFCLAGILLNEYIVGYAFMPNGSFQSLAARSAIWGIDAALIAWGIVTIIFRKREFVINFNIALTSLVIVSPFVGEVFIRTAIYLDVDYFRNPRLYAGWLDDDDQWKLRYSWGKAGNLQKAGFVADPLLGWMPQKSSDNPLGILADAPYNPDFNEKTVLFYGDSCVYGTKEMPVNKIVYIRYTLK